MPRALQDLAFSEYLLLLECIVQCEGSHVVGVVLYMCDIPWYTGPAGILYH